MDQRIGPDGLPAQDVSVNPKAEERKRAELEARRLAEEGQRAPWSRERVERHIRLAQEQAPIVIEGMDPVRTGPNLHGADLSGLDLSGLDLSRANLHGANLKGAVLSGARLVGANLCDAALSGSSVEGANAVGANFSGACLCGSKVGRTHMMGANLSGCCAEAADGLDVTEKPATPAELMSARYKRAEGFRADFLPDEQGNGGARVRYVGERLEKSNLTGLSALCKRGAKR